MGFPHPDFLLGVLTSRQISEWMAYYSLEPFGQYPEYLRAGIIAATIANVHKGKRGRAFSPEDFMPKEPKRPASSPKSQSVEEQKIVLQGIVTWAKKRGLIKKLTPTEKKKSTKRK